MKKKISLLILAFILTKGSVAIEHTVSPKKIIGKWNCTILYPSLNIKTIDRIEYLDDHSTFGIGYIFVKKDFVYETFHTGSWKLNGNMLTEIISQYSMIPVHPDFTMKKLKLDKNYADTESRIYNILLNGFHSNTPINFDIKKTQENEFHFEHILEDKHYQGVCEKV